MNLATIFVIVALAAFLTTSLSYVMFFNGAQHLRTITVTATGAASANPAAAKVYVTLNATGSSASLANANLATLVNRLNNTVLPYLNGNLSNIQTTSYQIYQPTNCTYPISQIYPPVCIPHTQNYFVAIEGIAVTVPSISNVPQLVTQISAIPNLALQNVQAQLSDAQKSALNQQALSQALANATTQARLLAGSGTSLVIQNITVTNSQFIYPFAGAGALSVSSKSLNGTAFFGGVTTIQKSVYVVFSMH